MTVTPVTVIAVAWVVRISAVAPVVIWSPPTPIRAADPTHLLDLCSRVCLDWCDWHRGRSGSALGVLGLWSAGWLREFRQCPSYPGPIAFVSVLPTPAYRGRNFDFVMK